MIRKRKNTEIIKRNMMLENCGKSIQWFIKSEKQFPEECARERVVMGQECINWIEKVWRV